MLAYLNFPTWIKPEVIPGLPFRWYSVMYIVAFAVTYLMMQYQLKKDPIREKIDNTHAAGLFIAVVVGLLLGARVFWALVYGGAKYWRNPFLIIWPFENGTFTGLSGISYHGGVIGGLLGAFIYSKRKKLNFLAYIDLIIAGLPLGYTFGRLGNFINAELYGRVTSSPLGMIFSSVPSEKRFSMDLPWVQEFVEKNDLQHLIYDGKINLPRHPSQLYEAFFEGIVLWVIIWFVFRKRRKFDGQLLSIYIIGYGFFRFFIEYARKPDEDPGFILSLKPSITDLEVFHTFWNFSLGQLLCFFMMVAGTAGLFYFNARSKKQKLLAEMPKEKSKNRKIRKKIK